MENNFKILLKFYITTIILVKNINGYSKVLISGTANTTNTNLEEKPNIIKSLNMDLVFPKIFNTTDSITTYNNNVTETTIESTGRAIDYRAPFQLPRTPSNIKPSYWNAPQKNYNYPVYRRPSITQAEINKFKGTGAAMDRYTPAEGAYKNLYNLRKNTKQKFSASGSQKTETIAKPNSRPNPRPNLKSNSAPYIPPKNIYSFPPNINAKYPPPKLPSPSSQITSYVAPPSGQATKDVSSYVPAPSGPDFLNNGFVGPVNPAYLPASMANMDNEKDKVEPAPDATNDMADMNMGMGENDGKSNGPQDNDTSQDDHPDSDNQDDHDHDPDHEHDHDHDHNHDMQDSSADHNHDDNPMPPSPQYEDKEYPTPPPGYMPDYHDHDHNHNHYDHHPPQFFGHHDHHSPQFFHHHPWDYGSHGIDSHPEIIYDDHDHHHHHHHTEAPPPPPPPTTTELPPEPEEPRVKKYSYFYLGRKLWYIPLYFTVWFSFYVLWLIIKSIARHKVNLPNHVVNRRSLPFDGYGITNLSHKEATEYIDELTINIMDKIDNFKNKI